MAPRFEVVSAPIEERLQSTLQAQVLTLLSTTQTVFIRANVHRSHIGNALADEAFVSRAATTAATLALPSSVPGALLISFLLLKLASAVLVRLFARRALRRSRATHVKES
jgi:hypothetical protein